MKVDRDLRKRASGQVGRRDGLRSSIGRIKVTIRADEQGDWMLKAA